MRSCGTGTEALLASVGSHGTPFVVIAFEPYLEKILKATIVSDVGRGEMGVIIENRLGCGVLVIQTLRRL
jgi:hypothetical protein